MIALHWEHHLGVDGVDTCVQMYMFYIYIYQTPLSPFESSSMLVELLC